MGYPGTTMELELAAVIRELKATQATMVKLVLVFELNDATRRLYTMIGSASSAIDMAIGFATVAQTELVELQARELVHFTYPSKPTVTP